MMRKAALVILYFISIGYIFSILMPMLYCYQHGCTGPDGDAFMPAFFLTPLGGVATAFSLQNAIQQIKKKQSWSWVFWPLAVVFAVVLIGVIGFVAVLVYELKFHH